MVDNINDRQLLAQLTNEDGESTGAPFELPANITPKQLQMLANAVLEHVRIDMSGTFYRLHECHAVSGP
jgi:nanoRNase/pAp phosphatase (c-di-AMP/oligoRNAs hydrolase)